VFNFPQQERKGKGGHTLSAGEAPDEELARAAPLPCRRRLERRRPSERASDLAREREREEKRKGAREREGRGRLAPHVGEAHEKAHKRSGRRSARYFY